MKRFQTAGTQLQFAGPDKIFSGLPPKTSDKNLEDHAPHCISSSDHSHQNDFKIKVQNDKSVIEFEAAPTLLRPSALALSFSQGAPA